MRVAPFGILRVAALGLWLSVTVSGQAGLATLSLDLVALLTLDAQTPVRAIVRGDVDVIQAVATRDQLPVHRVLDGLVVVEATPAQLSALRSVSGVVSISRDARVAPFMTISQKALAADQARAGTSGLLGIGAYPAVTGKGVGVAVIDSGIATAHQALSGKVAFSINFATGESSTNDGFGHGTHIAGIIAGSPTAATWVTSQYKGGIAPGAHLINVKVLGAKGSGYTSDVIAGIQWAVANRTKYSIKVLNLSLGHPQVEMCLTDPLCLAVEQAAMAGLVVVVSAGNTGKNAAGQEVLASITTPGAAPSAVTVGALNTWATDDPDDDTVTTYSSRGPTRFDLGVKPDVVAPGNKIVSLRAQNSYLASQYPELTVAGSGNNGYMKMSGTSMAAGMVSGGAALLLEGGVLTARQVKVALQLSARFMTSEGLLRAGLGRTNLYSARRVNSAVTTLTTIPSVTIAGRTVEPTAMMTGNGQPLLDGLLAPVGAILISPLELLARWLDMSPLPSRLAALTGGQMIWGDQLPAQQMIWGDQSPFGQQMIWGDLTPWGQQMIWGDQSTAEQMLWGDQTLLGQQMIWGDQTSGMQMIWGDQASGQQMIWGDANSSNANQMIWGDSTPGDGQ